MKKKLTVCFGLVLLAALVTVLVVWFMPAAEPPLRVGMDADEVSRVLGPPTRQRPIDDDFSEPSAWFTETEHDLEPDVLGGRQRVIIEYRLVSIRPKVIMRVESWEVHSLPRTRPPWLNKAMKWVGW